MAGFGAFWRDLARFGVWFGVRAAAPSQEAASKELTTGVEGRRARV